MCVVRSATGMGERESIVQTVLMLAEYFLLTRQFKPVDLYLHPILSNEILIFKKTRN